MLIAMFADIHANRQAFAACLAQARDFGAERNVLLGDYVGYGADPEWTVKTVMDLVEKGAIAVRGNHDNAVGDAREHSTSRPRLSSSGRAANSDPRSESSSNSCRLHATTMTASTFMPTPAVRKAGVMSWILKMLPAA